jgi:hypothetical protein
MIGFSIRKGATLWGVYTISINMYNLTSKTNNNKLYHDYSSTLTSKTFTLKHTQTFTSLQNHNKNNLLFQMYHNGLHLL